MPAAPPRTLSSNGAPIAFDDRHFAPQADHTGMLGDPAALREAYERSGYVRVTGLLDPAALRDLRRAYFSRFDPAYLAPGSDPADGTFSGVRPPMAAHGTADHPAHGFVRGDHFLRLCADPRLQAVAEVLLGSAATQLPRRILRHFDRSRKVASRAHTDFTYLDGGSDRLVTAWIPIGDCPLPTGGLVYLDGSHHLGPDRLAALRARRDRADDTRPLSHDLAWVAEQTGRRWLWADYRAGDVVFHSPHLVHASLDVTSDTMRLSADLRWLAEGEARDERWAAAWSGDDGN